MQKVLGECVFRARGCAIQKKSITLRPNTLWGIGQLRKGVVQNKSEVMKAKKIFTTLVVAVATLLMVGCSFYSTEPNEVSFDTGATVGHSTKYQFISIASELAWRIEVEYLAPESESGWCSLNKTSGEGNDNVMMTFGENKLSEDRSLNLVVTFPNETITLLFTQRSAQSQTDQADLSGWLELPSFEEDGTRFYFSKHMLPSKNYKERSFSLFYDADNYYPLWVAYPLCKGNIGGSGGRVNDWGIFDPNIPSNKQLYMSSSYNGRYDRGHMLPSASRLGNDEDNRQTFYPTNMTPQLDQLNQQKWAKIEGQVRNWAEGCDTLYVVTGAVLQTVGGGESVARTYCKSDSSKSVAIPNYYYKALLQYTNRNGVKTYQAIALWVPHKAASGAATLDDAMTIDELEALTGLDFFPNLDPATQASVESVIDNRYWGL